MMTSFDEVIDEALGGVDRGDHENRPAIAKAARQRARITCRELGGVLGLQLSQISGIERGRIDVSDNVMIAIVFVCAAKMMVQKEMGSERKPSQ